MAQHTVNIFIDSISPNSLTAHPGDSVQFVLKRTDAVTLEFRSSAGTPFARPDIALDGSNALTAQSAQTILASALGMYGFDVVTQGATLPVDPDPPAGTLSGDIDVTPDGPRSQRPTM